MTDVVVYIVPYVFNDEDKTIFFPSTHPQAGRLHEELVRFMQAYDIFHCSEVVENGHLVDLDTEEYDLVKSLIVSRK